MTITVTRTRVTGPTAAAVYQLEAFDGEVHLLRETVSVALTTADPLAALTAAETAFAARAEQIATNLAVMPE